MKPIPLLLLIAMMTTSSCSIALDLQSSLLQAITNKYYQEPTSQDLYRGRHLFRQTLDGTHSATELATSWATLGFEFREVEANGEQLWLVTQPSTKQSGGGWYLFRPNNYSNLALEAPHARNDINTGLIAFRLFCAGKARVLAASTITRHRADMGHVENTYFQAFTLAFADAFPAGLIVQVHGFETENHEGSKADVVASAGTRSPGAWLAQFVQDLRKATSLLILAYPRDTKLLGATLNVQGKALQAYGRCRFLHLEMTAQLRERFTHDDKLCREAMNCLQQVQNQ